jgi:FkbM family methyltransferase
MHLLRKIGKSLARRRAAALPFPAVAAFRGAIFVLDPANWIDNRILAGIPFETEQLDSALALVGRERIDLVVDVGANFGLYSVLLGLAPGVRDIVAFEPVSVNHAQLLANAFANRLCDRLVAHRLGCGDGEATATIHIDPVSTGVSRLDPATTHRDTSAFSRREEIRLVPGDSLLPHAGRRAFVKIDVEGHAAEAVRGMEGFLSRNACHLQVEMIGAEREAATATLAGLGYRLERMIENDGLFRRG